MADPSETTQVGSLGSSRDDELVDAVRSLSAQVSSLQHELQSLRAEGRTLPPGEARPGWEDRASMPRDGSAWVRSLDTPSARRLRIPWLPLEIAFLVVVAALGAVAGLDAPVLAGVMVAAWALVAVAEWLLARAARAEHAVVYGPGPPGTRVPEDPSWFAPPLDDTELDLVEPSDRAPARLPPPTD